MVDQVVIELERQRHPGVTASHEFALNAIEAGAQNASALGRSLNVSKQAAAKSIAALEELGYVKRQNDPLDARRKMLLVTPRGREMMALGAQAFDEVRARLLAQVGSRRLETLEGVLTALTSASKEDASSRG